MRHKHNTKPTGNLWYTASIQVSTRREEFGVEPEEGERPEEGEEPGNKATHTPLCTTQEVVETGVVDTLVSQDTAASSDTKLREKFEQ